MRFPPAGWAWPPGPRVAAAHDSGVDGRGRGAVGRGAVGRGVGGASLGARKALCKPHLAFSETKLSLPPGSAAHPVQNSPSTPGSTAHPVQNSPSEPQNADFGPPFACRENFVPLPPPTTRAGRTLSRMWCHFRYKTLPAARLGGPPGTKLSQQAALAGPPGTKLSQQAPKRRFRPTFRMQGELCTASATNTTSREKKVTHQHPTAPQQRAPPQISHAIRLNELSTKPRNVAIPTT